MQRRFRVLSALSIAALVLTSCGGGSDSSSRTRNSALCYETQEEKDASNRWITLVQKNKIMERADQWKFWEWYTTELSESAPDFD